MLKGALLCLVVAVAFLFFSSASAKLGSGAAIQFVALNASGGSNFPNITGTTEEYYDIGYSYFRYSNLNGLFVNLTEAAFVNSFSFIINNLTQPYFNTTSGKKQYIDANLTGFIDICTTSLPNSRNASCTNLFTDSENSNLTANRLSGVPAVISASYTGAFVLEFTVGITLSPGLYVFGVQSPVEQTYKKDVLFQFIGKNSGASYASAVLDYYNYDSTASPTSAATFVASTAFTPAFIISTSLISTSPSISAANSGVSSVSASGLPPSGAPSITPRGEVCVHIEKSSRTHKLLNSSCRQLGGAVSATKRSFCCTNIPTGNGFSFTYPFDSKQCPVSASVAASISIAGSPVAASSLAAASSHAAASSVPSGSHSPVVSLSFKRKRGHGKHGNPAARGTHFTLLEFCSELGGSETFSQVSRANGEPKACNIVCSGAR